MFLRDLKLPENPDNSFFLWGPRQTGKSTLLKKLYPNAYRIDLLEATPYTQLLHDPGLLRKNLQEEKVKPPIVIIDEIQKVPPLLDEVHWMIENMGIVFGLCGSSARKVRRGQANLLGGRAIRNELWGLTHREMGSKWNLIRALNAGSLPRIYLSKDHKPLLDAYVSTYLKEEIIAEGIVRKLPAFADALHAIALSDGDRLSYKTIGEDCYVHGETVREYVQILEDTLLGSFLHAYRKRPKRRTIHKPKFYFFDVGVVNVLARRGEALPKSSAFGKALENWIHHEIRTHSSYSALYYNYRYWRTSSGHEVDFILGDMDVAIEVKATDRVCDHHLKSLRKVAEDYKIRRRICVSLEPRGLKTDDGIEILPVERFLEELWEGEIIK